MMFYCEECRIKNKWPEAFGRSHGKCECCDTVTRCHDRPSSTLPPVRRTPAEQPAPASTGREVQDVLRAAADALRNSVPICGGNVTAKVHNEAYVAVCEAIAAPVAARELDVEDERREFEASEIAHQQARHPQEPLTAEEKEYLLRRDPQQRDTYAACGGEWEGWLRRAARSAAQGTKPESAQVSTEQAGDAVIEAARKLIKAKGRYHTEQSYKALMAEVQAYNALGDAVQKMDSPNNSPVGAAKSGD